MGDILLEHAKSKFDMEERALQQVEMTEKRKQELLLQVSCMMGRTQAFGYVSKFSKLSELASIKKLKDNKVYRDLGINTWAAFCELFGMNHKSLDEQLLCLETLGLEFLEASQKIGLTRQDLRRIQALPSDTRVDAINAATSLDNPTKEQIRDLLDQLDDQTIDNDMLKKNLKESEDKLSQKDKTITRGQDQVTALEDKIRVIQKQQDISLIRNDEQASFDLLKEIKRSFNNQFLAFRRIDLDAASPAIRASVAALLEYLNRMLSHTFLNMCDAYPEMDVQHDLLNMPEFKNVWDHIGEELSPVDLEP